GEALRLRAGSAEEAAVGVRTDVFGADHRFNGGGSADHRRGDRRPLGRAAELRLRAGPGSGRRLLWLPLRRGWRLLWRRGRLCGCFRFDTGATAAGARGTLPGWPRLAGRRERRLHGRLRRPRGGVDIGGEEGEEFLRIFAEVLAV